MLVSLCRGVTTDKPKSRKMIDVFISHSHDDTNIAKALVDFLVEGPEIKKAEVRCTSVRGAGLRMGSKIAHQLRKDIEDCYIFLPLLTPRTKVGGFVTLEIGAAWGLNKQCLPVLYQYDGEIPDVLRDVLFCNLGAQDDVVGLGDAVHRAVFSGRPNKDDIQRIHLASQRLSSRI